MGRLVVVSNRTPVGNPRTGSAGGLAVALGSVLAKRDALWIGWNGEISEMAEAPVHRRVRRTEIVGFSLTAAQHAGFYTGFANGTLWPLFHYRLGLMEYRRSEYAAYLTTNDSIAQLVMSQIKPGDVLWVHDYHLIPLARALRRLGVTNRIGFFLHIPWPAAEVFRSLPVHADLAEALAHFDLIGFQTETCASQFRNYLGLEAAAHGWSHSMYGRHFRAAAFPIGIDTQESSALAAAASLDGQRLLDNLGNRALIIGVDRLDYSKGLPNRIAGYGEFLERNPGVRGKVQYLQIAPISRGEVANYRALRRELDGLAGRINGKHAEFDWTPLRYVNKGYPRRSLAAFYRLARVGLVTPLRDGMNLVAKEFVAAQRAEDPGVLLLSEFAGAAAEMTGALKVNPYDTTAIADLLGKALEMPYDERLSRWRADMDTITRNTATAWADTFLGDLLHKEGDNDEPHKM